MVKTYAGIMGAVLLLLGIGGLLLGDRLLLGLLNIDLVEDLVTLPRAFSSSLRPRNGALVLRVAS
jgi:hypothetical protein